MESKLYYLVNLLCSGKITIFWPFCVTREKRRRILVRSHNASLLHKLPQLLGTSVVVAVHLCVLVGRSCTIAANVIEYRFLERDGCAFLAP